ncbi:MAG: MotA/TolQ/ExbB proton channel family protein [Planctomycetota bacterium]
MRRVRALFGVLLAAGVFAALLACPSLGLTTQSQVAAQEEPAPEAAPAPAPAAPAPAAPAATPASQKSYLRWTYEALGWRYTLAFLILSFAFFTLLIMNILQVRRSNICPIQLVEAFEAQVNEKQMQAAYELAKNDPSVLGKCLAAGVEKIQGGVDAGMKAMTEVGEDENMRMEHRLGYMALIGTIAPMVGLLGTVDGMVASFSVIASSTSTPKPSELATGISMALVTTLAGLVIAIPALMVFNLQKNYAMRLMFETGLNGENLLQEFSKLLPGKKP